MNPSQLSPTLIGGGRMWGGVLLGMLSKGTIVSS